MIKVTLDPRLSAILQQLDVGDRVVDVGCDHGKIAVLAVNRTGNKVIATDISVPSLDKAKRLAEACGVYGEIDFRAGDGLGVVKPDEADTAVIAGMGGMEIIKIIDAYPQTLKKYVLMPHLNARELREFLLSKSLVITRDYVVQCNKRYYTLLVAEGSAEQNIRYTERELLFGREYTPDFFAFKADYTAKLRRIIPAASEERRAQLTHELELLEGIKEGI